MTAEQEPAQPDCPRCGYDLSGDTATWTSACPLRGVCPECGLAFLWGELLGSSARRYWLVENTGFAFPQVFRRTCLRALRPARFWAQVSMAERPVWGRLTAYAAAAWLIVISSAGLFEIVHELIFGPLGALVSSPLTWYSSPPDPLSGITAAMGNALAPFGLVQFSPWPGYSPSVLYDLLWAPIFILLCPLGYLLLPATLGRMRVKKQHLMRAFLYGWPWAMLWTEAALLLSLTIETARDVLWWGPLHWLSQYFVTTGLLWMAVLLACQWRWWLAVNREYLRLPRPRLVTASMITVVGLLVLVLMFGVSGTGARLLYPL